MKTRQLFNISGIVLLLLSHLPGTGQGLRRRAEELGFDFSDQSMYRVIGQMKEAGLIRFDGNAARRGGGKRYVVTETGRQIATEYRHILAIVASHFPDKST